MTITKSTRVFVTNAELKVILAKALEQQEGLKVFVDNIEPSFSEPLQMAGYTLDTSPRESELHMPTPMEACKHATLEG